MPAAQAAFASEAVALAMMRPDSTADPLHLVKVDRLIVRDAPRLLATVDVDEVRASVVGVAVGCTDQRDFTDFLFGSGLAVAPASEYHRQPLECDLRSSARDRCATVGRFARRSSQLGHAGAKPTVISVAS